MDWRAILPVGVLPLMYVIEQFYYLHYSYTPPIIQDTLVQPTINQQPAKQFEPPLIEEPKPSPVIIPPDIKNYTNIDLLSELTKNILHQLYFFEHWRTVSTILFCLYSVSTIFLSIS